MADPEPETLARWRANRRRMVRDLQQQIDALLDCAERGSLETLSPDGDAVVFSRALRALTDAAGGDMTALRRLVADNSSGDSSMTDGDGDSTAAVEEVVGLRGRVADLETHVVELADVARARSDRIEGLQRTLDAYRSFGEVTDVQASFDRWRAIAGVLLRMLIDSEQVCAQYEAVLGPMLLQLDRRCSNLSAFLESLAGAASPPLQPSRSLLAGLVDLGIDPEDAAVDLRAAIKTLQQRERSASLSDSDLSALRQHPLMVIGSAEFQALLQSTGRGNDVSGPTRVCSLLELFDKTALTELYESLRTAGRVPAFRVFESISSGRSAGATTTIGSPAAAVSEARAGSTASAPGGLESESEDFGAGSTPPCSTKRRRLVQGGRPLKHRRQTVQADSGETKAPSSSGGQEVIVLSESGSAGDSDQSIDHSSSSEDELSLHQVALALSSRKKHNIAMPNSQSKLAKIRERVFDNIDGLTYTTFDDLFASWTRTSDSPGIPTEIQVLRPSAVVRQPSLPTSMHRHARSPSIREPPSSIPARPDNQSTAETASRVGNVVWSASKLSVAQSTPAASAPTRSNGLSTAQHVAKPCNAPSATAAVSAPDRDPKSTSSVESVGNASPVVGSGRPTVGSIDSAVAGVSPAAVTAPADGTIGSGSVSGVASTGRDAPQGSPSFENASSAPSSVDTIAPAASSPVPPAADAIDTPPPVDAESAPASLGSSVPVAEI
ncbi:hypothetical protein ATCC90586_012114 [Pythium insidiosum]|nr:hypothetical protein ATCC90586_012114 [Pythium insidiosum]